MYFVMASVATAKNTKKSFANQVIGKYNSKISNIFNSNFSHYSEAEPLVNLMEIFARSQGLRAAFTENVKGDVSGRFNDIEPELFLAGIYTAFGVEWYVLDDILHFYVKRDLERRLVYLSAAKPSDMKKILLDAGLLSQQLSCNVDDNKKVIIFSGPSSYADGVATAIKSYEDSYRNEQEVKVFFLKHAWAADTAVGAGDSKQIIPGVASILREMVLKVQYESTQLAMGTGKGAAVRDTVPPEEIADFEGVDVTIEQLRKEAKEQMELDRKVASPMHAQSKRLPEVEGSMIQPTILADSRSNSVIVRDARYRMSYYEKVIKDLDKALDLIEIHAAIVDVDTNYSRSLGFDIGGATHIGDFTGVGAGNNIGSIVKPIDIIGGGDNLSPIISAGFNFTTVYSHGVDYFLAKVDALEAQGNARVLGRPSILTIDNASASISASTTFYIRVIGEKVVELKEVSSGTSLMVTPHIIRYDDGESQIKLSVKIEDGKAPSTGNVDNDIPAVVKKTNIETQGYINHGQSMLIGGYYYETSSTNDTGIPVLVDLPIVGKLFNKTQKDVQRMERLILISPRIIKSRQKAKPPLNIDTEKFYRSPLSTEYGGVEEIQPEPVGGCAAKNANPNNIQ